MISYQGKLMQPSGASVPDGIYSIQFAIHDVPTGGAALWSETNDSVHVKGGLFNVLLGSINNLPPKIFGNPDRFFAVEVGSDPEMTPRQKIASVGFAVRAGSADVAITVPDASITNAKLAPAAVTTGTLALGAVTADRLATGVSIPPGAIVMWSGATSQIPQGWALCDGTNGTPDLRERFIVGAGSGYVVGTTGGEASYTLTVPEMPSHSQEDGMAVIGTYQMPSGSYDAVFVAGRDATLPTGGNQPHENRPPYCALCFTMRLAY